MDANPQNEIFTTAPKPFYKNKLAIVLIVILLQTGYTLALLNFSKTKLSNQKQVSVNPPPEKTISENELPVGLELLKNPIVNQWRGAVEGVLVAKDEQSITLSNINKNAKITIPLNPPQGEKGQPMTVFHSLKLAKAGKNTRVELKDIPVGKYLRGDFFVVPWLGDKNRTVGSSFTIVDE